MTKKHLIISSYDDLKNPYYAGGGAVSVHEIAKKLSDDYEVTVVTSRHKNASQNEVIDSVTYKRIGFTPNFFPPLGQIIFQISLPWAVLTNSFDVWMESFTPPFSVAFLPLFTNKPVIGLVHFLSGQEMSKKYRLPFAEVEKIGLRCYSKFITPNSVTKNKILEIQPKAKVAVISNGIEIPTKINQNKKKQIGFIGRIEVNQKGLDLLLEAFSQSHLKDWSLVIAGSGPAIEEKKLKKFITKYNLSDKVTLLGRIDGKAKDTFFQNISILAVPSRFETFSLSALEALSYGLPIVTFDIPGLAWLPKFGVTKAKAFSSADLSKKVTAIAADKKLRVKMSKTNREFSQQFSWAKTTQKYRAFIEGGI